MSKAGKAFQSSFDLSDREPERPSGAIGHRRILPVVTAPQRRENSQIEAHNFLALVALDKNSIGRREALVEIALDRYANNPRAGIDLLRNLLAPIFVDADDRDVARLLVGEDLGLYLDIVFHAAMPVEVIGSDVRKDGRIRFEGRHHVVLLGQQVTTYA